VGAQAFPVTISKTQTRIPASVCIIAYNEEERIEECLSSVRAFDEIIVVVDAKTTDNTAGIAAHEGAKVFIEEWKGYGPQKQSSIEKCRNEWILSIDADESLPDETVEEISALLAAPGADAYSLKRKNFFHGRWMRYGDWWPDRQVRLFRKDRGRFVSMVHEKWEGTGTLQRLSCPLIHRPFRNYSEMLKTMDSYSTLLAGELYAKGVRTNTFSPLIHAAAMFFKIYIAKMGFLDGFDGIVTAILKASGSFFKYAKLLELQRGIGASGK
jgi:glycosyltransferase involved in cell wall biosynthesis